MPKLNDEPRGLVTEQDRLYRAAFKTYTGFQYVSQNCRVCNMASSRETLEAAIKANRIHENNHTGVKEYDEFSRNHFGFDLMRDALHDHDCQMKSCICRCGCDDGLFCVLVMGSLCSVCMVRDLRGDDEHGNPVPHEELPR